MTHVDECEGRTSEYDRVDDRANMRAVRFNAARIAPSIAKARSGARGASPPLREEEPRTGFHEMFISARR